MDSPGDGDVDPVADRLAHFGIKGMKWGHRRAEKKARKSETSADAKSSIDVRDKVKSHSVKAVTNKQLKTAIERMNLEQNFKRISVNEKGAVGRFVSSLLMDIGKQRMTEIGHEKSKDFLKAKGILKTAAKVAAVVA